MRKKEAMKTRPGLALLLVAALAAPVTGGETPAAAAGAPKLPYVYTNWKQFTVADGLPNDHIFAVKVDGPRVWVGTEDGLALIDRPTGKVVRTWQEKDGLPFKVVTAIDVDQKTGDVWLGLFGGGLARLSGGRFDHWHQLNSGLVNDVVYGVAIENDNVWAATTAGASRLNTVTGEWTVFTEKNAPMEEIWNYAASYDGKDKVYLAVWGSGVLEYSIKTGRWKEYLDPDGEMEIDLYRDDGINHVIVTGASPAEGVVWISSYFGGSRYDGRHWRGYAQQEGGLPSDFLNNIKGRSAQEALFCSDKGLGIITDAPNEDATWVAYTRDPETGRGRAKVTVGGKVVENVDMPAGVPHSFMISVDVDGNDIWVGTSKGLGWGIGDGYYPGTKERALYAYGQPAPEPKGAPATAEAGKPPVPPKTPKGGK
jgi:ligand-binding sensor domain-containing protein